MVSSTVSSNLINGDQEIWQNLQEAISKSSGFQNWQKENQLDISLEEQVKKYLRSTLETLAY